MGRLRGSTRTNREPGTSREGIVRRGALCCGSLDGLIGDIVAEDVFFLLRSDDCVNHGPCAFACWVSPPFTPIRPSLDCACDIHHNFCVWYCVTAKLRAPPFPFGA